MERSVVHLSFWAWLCAVSIHISAFDCCTRRALDLLTQAVILMWKMFCNCSEEVFLKKQFPITAAQNENVEPKSTLSATLPNLKMNAKQEEKRNPS